MVAVFQVLVGFGDFGIWEDRVHYAAQIVRFRATGAYSGPATRRMSSIHAFPFPFITKLSFTLSGFSPFLKKNGVSSVVQSVVPVSGD